MAATRHDLPQYASAWEGRDHLPRLASSMSEEDLKLLRLWDGRGFEANQTYFDLDNPGRGPFTATGHEAIPNDWTYVRERDIPPEVWAKLITWMRPLDEGAGETLARQSS